MSAERTDTLAAYYLGYDETDTIIDVDTELPFDRESYSRMKYGDIAATKGFARDVAGVLKKESPELVESPRAPEFLVAYKAVPPACFYLSRYCLDIINTERLAEDNEPGRLIHVYKNRVAATNYAAASQQERQKELDDIGFSLEGRTVQGKNVVVLDDIRITGAAERKMLEVVMPDKPNRVALGYIALFNEEQASVSPSVENDLNVSVIKGVDNLLPLMEAGNFDLNIRTLKLILGTDQEVLVPFLEQVPEEVLENITRGAVDTGVDFVSQYAGGFQAALSVQNEKIG